MLESGSIDRGDAERYWANYEFFEQNRPYIEQELADRWVGSLDHDLLAADDSRELQARLGEHAHGNRAYVEYAGHTGY